MSEVTNLTKFSYNAEGEPKPDPLRELYSLERKFFLMLVDSQELGKFLPKENRASLHKVD